LLFRKIGGAAFYDVGTVNEDSGDFGGGRYRHGVGAGIYLESVIGPIRFDFAVNPDRESGEDSWVVHFLLGHPF
jgi:outer membrane translocation and assembly module TamA